MSEEQKRLIDVPAEILAANVVSSMIKARGVINLWDAMILRLIVDMRKEAADDLALATSARTTQELVATLLCCDPEDGRDGFWLSLEDKQRLSKLPAGTKLYTAIREEVK